jgi:hypothetical protein
MELDDFRKSGKKETVSQFREAEIKSDKMESTIGELKVKDAEERRKTRMFIILFFVFVAVYSGSLGLHQGGMRTGFSILVLAFVLILGYVFWRFQRLKSVDYAAPATMFLKEAEKRHKFMTTRDWVITIPLLILLITGGSIIVHSTFIRYFSDSLVPLFIYLGLMAGVLAFSFGASIKNWKKSKGAMLEKIRQMQQELGVNE